MRSYVFAECSVEEGYTVETISGGACGDCYYHIISKTHSSNCACRTMEAGARSSSTDYHRKQLIYSYCYYYTSISHKINEIAAPIICQLLCTYTNN